MNLNDNRLIIKTLKSGDQKVFSLVYASYYKPLCLFCSSYVSLEEAEEIVQDLMMYVWEKRELLVEDLSLKSFLFTSVRNRALNSITRSHITRQVYEEYQSQQLKSLPALDSCYGTELFNTYMEALHSLPKELQRVYVMSRYKQLTHKEIADKLVSSSKSIFPSFQRRRIDITVNSLEIDATWKILSLWIFNLFSRFPYPKHFS